MTDGAAEEERRLDAAAEGAILTLTAARGPEKSICPSEAARLLSAREDGQDTARDAWRAHQPRVRRVAAALQAEGRLRVTQKGVDVDAATARGPVRLRAVSRPDGADG